MSFDLSIIIPLYNEERRLSKTFDEVRRFLRTRPNINTEVIFVDDGSSDGTTRVVEAFLPELAGKGQLIKSTPNQGKGSVVRQGMLAAHGDYRLMVDADMSTSLDELDKCQEFMKNKVPIIIGTRKDHGAQLVKKQPWYRQKMGEAYAVFARFATGLTMKDFGCGFKLFSAQAAHNIFSRAFVNRWIFDTEVLVLARQLGYPVAEVGVIWINDEDTRVHFVRDGAQALYDLVRIYLKHTRRTQ